MSGVLEGNSGRWDLWRYFSTRFKNSLSRFSKISIIREKWKNEIQFLPDFIYIISLFERLRDFFAQYVFCYYHHLLDVNLLSPPPTLSAHNWFILCHTRAASERVKSFNEPWCLLVILKKIQALGQIVKIKYIVYA